MNDLSAALLTLLAVTLYGGLHSLLASTRAKALAERLAGQTANRWYRLTYNLIGGLTFLPVLAVPARWPGTVLYQIPWPWSVAPLALQVLALALLVIGLMQADVFHFLGLRQLRGSTQTGPPRLEVRGLHRWVRHPLYTAGLMFIWLTPVMTTSSLALTLGLTFYIYLGSIHEERRLADEFGDAYLDYQRRVPRLIPRLRNGHRMTEFSPES